jgi:hypothetical protein
MAFATDYTKTGNIHDAWESGLVATATANSQVASINSILEACTDDMFTAFQTGLKKMTTSKTIIEFKEAYGESSSRCNY